VKQKKKKKNETKPRARSNKRKKEIINVPNAPPRALMSPEELKLYNEQRKNRSFSLFIVPFIYAPLLPLIRIGFKKNPPARDFLFASALACGLGHAGYVMAKDSSV